MNRNRNITCLIDSVVFCFSLSLSLSLTISLFPFLPVLTCVCLSVAHAQMILHDDYDDDLVSFHFINQTCNIIQQHPTVIIMIIVMIVIILTSILFFFFFFYLPTYLYIYYQSNNV